MEYSKLCIGQVFHARYTPKSHQFMYRVFMVLIDLEKIDDVLQRSRWWGKNWWHLARFKREDFHGDPEQSVSDAIRGKVKKDLNIDVKGPILALANLRYFGYNMNPLVTYFCYSERFELRAIVAEVNNTPWGERHAYSLECDTKQETQQISFDKAFTVSPFNPLNMEYRWRSNNPLDSRQSYLEVHIANFQGEKRIFEASMRLKKEPFNARRMNRLLLSYPVMTVKVLAAIYWEALRLFLKSVPFLGKNKTHDF